MPDLAMCQDHLCPSAKRCYRHEAEPFEYQSYQDFGRGRQAEKCGHFILTTVSTKKRLDIQTGRQGGIGV